MPELAADGHEFTTTQKWDEDEIPQPEGPGWVFVESHTEVVTFLQCAGEHPQWCVVWSFLWARKLREACPECDDIGADCPKHGRQTG